MATQPEQPETPEARIARLEAEKEQALLDVTGVEVERK